MNKNILLFFSMLLLVPCAMPLTAMEKPSSPPSKQSGISVPPTGSATTATVTPQPIHSMPPTAAKLASSALPPIGEPMVEIELDPADTFGFAHQKATNYVLGTHTTLLLRLQALKSNEKASNSLANQAVILSAVTNLVQLCGSEKGVVKKATLEDVAALLKYAESGVITIDRGPADALKTFLMEYQQKLFAAFHEHIKPVQQIAELIGKADGILGNKPSDVVTLDSLSFPNIRKLDTVMRAMAGQSVDRSDTKLSK